MPYNIAVIVINGPNFKQIVSGLKPPKNNNNHQNVKLLRVVASYYAHNIYVRVVICVNKNILFSFKRDPIPFFFSFFPRTADSPEIVGSAALKNGLWSPGPVFYYEFRIYFHLLLLLLFHHRPNISHWYVVISRENIKNNFYNFRYV